jgi:2-polyprenyl-3-methyl-5-hydroxy-6-metoxy-1,4-benzoquinol methylase
MAGVDAIDQDKVDAFAERLFGDLNSGMTCVNLYIGHKLGLFEALHQSGPVTPRDFAQRTGNSERYMREWLCCLAAGHYIDYDASAEKFSLSGEHARVLIDPDDPSYALGVMGWIPSVMGALPMLMEAFRTGGGVPLDQYGMDFVEAQGFGTRPMFKNDYVSTWIPAMPDIHTRLQQGGRVAEVGCGIGWSSIALAQGFPSIRVEGIDPDEASIKEARRNAAQAGVSDRVIFHRSTVESAPCRGPYALVTAFECIHDMPYPVEALRQMRQLASPGGTVLIADERVADTLEENRNFMGHLYYNFSVLHCLPQAMIFPNAAGTGTVITPSTMRRYAAEAGFIQVDVLPIENPMFRFYRLTP